MVEASDVRRGASWGLVVLLVLSVACAGCSVSAVPSKDAGTRPKPVVPPGGVLLRGAGATFPAVLYEEWFRAYQARSPTQVVTYDAVGSGEGVRRFIGRGVEAEERVEFGASDAAMRDDEMAGVPAGVQLLPLVAGAVALAYNLPDVPGDLRLSREAYTAIFLGQITKWNDPRIARTNPGVRLPNLTIATVVRQDSSGTTFAFTNHLEAISDSWRSQYGPVTLLNWPGNSMRAKGNEGVAGLIGHSVGAIGYVGYEAAKRAGLRMALLQNRAGHFVGPTEKGSTAALTDVDMPGSLRLFIPDPSQSDAYPIVTLTWALLYRQYPETQKAGALHDLFRWCLTDGQRYAAEFGYTPLPANIAQRSLAALENVQSISSR